jgi:hypothetical protein
MLLKYYLIEDKYKKIYKFYKINNILYCFNKISN